MSTPTHSKTLTSKNLAQAIKANLDCIKANHFIDTHKTRCLHPGNKGKRLDLLEALEINCAIKRKEEIVNEEIMRSKEKRSENGLMEGSVPVEDYELRIGNNSQTKKSPAPIGSERSKFRSPSMFKSPPMFRSATPNNGAPVHASPDIGIVKSMNRSWPLVEQVNQEYNYREDLRANQKIVSNLIKKQHILYRHHNKFTLSHLNALEEFRIQLDKFVDPLENLNKHKVSFISAKEFQDFEKNLAILTAVLANLNAFLITEYLYIFSQSKFEIELVFIFIATKTLKHIAKMGTVDQIKGKISFRSITGLEGSNFEEAILSRLNNSRIISDLQILFVPLTYEFLNDDNSKNNNNVSPRIFRSIENMTVRSQKNQNTLNEQNSTEAVISNAWTNSKYETYMFIRNSEVLKKGYPTPSTETTHKERNEKKSTLSPKVLENPPGSFIEFKENNVCNPEDSQNRETVAKNEKKSTTSPKVSEKPLSYFNEFQENNVWNSEDIQNETKPTLSPKVLENFLSNVIGLKRNNAWNPEYIHNRESVAINENKSTLLPKVSENSLSSFTEFKEMNVWNPEDIHIQESVAKYENKSTISPKVSENSFSSINEFKEKNVWNPEDIQIRESAAKNETKSTILPKDSENSFSSFNEFKEKNVWNPEDIQKRESVAKKERKSTLVPNVIENILSSFMKLEENIIYNPEDIQKLESVTKNENKPISSPKVLENHEIGFFEFEEIDDYDPEDIQKQESVARNERKSISPKDSETPLGSFTEFKENNIWNPENIQNRVSVAKMKTKSTLSPKFLDNPLSRFIHLKGNNVYNSRNLQKLEPVAKKIINYYSSYNLTTVIFSQLSNYTVEFISGENTNVVTYNHQDVLDLPINNEKNYEIQTNSIENLVHFSIMKIIILLNTMFYSIKTFDIEYCVAAFECFKDCLKILHYISAFNDSVLKEFSGETFIEIEEYFKPTLKICQAHLNAIIMSQSVEFIWSAKLSRGKNSKIKFQSEFLEFIRIFGNAEEINEKLSYRDNKVYNKLAQQISSIIPTIAINTSNQDIVTNIQSVNKSKRKSTKTQGTITFNFSDQLENDTIIRKCTEYENLHLNLDQIKKLLQLETTIFNDYENTANENFDNGDMKEFCVTLKEFEEFKERELKFGTFVHSFLNTIDNILSQHILRIFVSQFYSFAFYMISLHYSNSSRLKTKRDIKLHRRVLLELITDLCPIYKIPEKICFRNDEVFSRCTKKLCDSSGIVIRKSSMKLCKDISIMVKENGSFYEEFHKEYVSKPIIFNMQISMLEGKLLSDDELFYMRIKGNDNLIHFKEFAKNIMQATKLKSTNTI